MIENGEIMRSVRYRPAILIPLLFAGTCVAQTLYKSVDEQGHVTYSETPPADAVETKSVPIAPGPSRENAERARERARAMAEEADTKYQELMERRKEEEEARKKAERERADREAAERQRAADESSYEGPYPYGWRWPYPYPPIRPPIPPRPTHPIVPPKRPYGGHINPPIRNR